MDIAAVDLQLLKALLAPDLKLAPGRALMARVVRPELPQARGALSIAGTVLEAELPAHLKAGDEIRLVVRDAGSERVVLSLAAHQDAPPVASAPPPPPREAERAGQRGGSSAGAAAEDGHSLALRYAAPNLGAVDFRFGLDPGSLRLTVALAPGAPYEAASAAAGELEDSLARALGRPVAVTVLARRDPVDTYA